MPIARSRSAKLASVPIARSSTLPFARLAAIGSFGTFEIDLAGDRLTLSPGFWPLAGLGPAPVSASPAIAQLGRLIHPDDRDAVVVELDRLRHDGGRAVLGFRVIRLDGSVIEVAGMAERESDAGGDRLVAIVEDVTTKQETRRALQAHGDILASVRETVVASDLAGHITFWGNGAQAALGYRAEAMLGRPLRAVFGALADRQLAELASGSTDGARFEDVEVRHADGRVIRLDVRTSVIRGPSVAPAGLAVLAMDTTERDTAAVSLGRLRMAIEQSSDSVVITDASGTIEYVNPAFERISGYGRDEVIGQNPRLFKSGAQPPVFYQEMWSSLTAGRPFVADMVNRRKDGSTFEEQASISPIVDVHGAVTGYIAVKRDITEERRREKADLRRSRERTLIAQTIRGFEGTEDPESVAEAVGRQLSRLSGVATAGLFIFGLDGRAAPYGFTVHGEPRPGLAPVSQQRTYFLRRRAEQGAWIAAWEARPDHSFDAVFREAGVVAVAYAPVRHGRTLIGFIHLGLPGPDADAEAAANLPALVEFADITGALLGRHIIDRALQTQAHLRVSTVIARGAFWPVFQPIVDIGRHRIVGYEGLTRFRDGVGPDRHFAEAERAGLGLDLEVATLHAALAAARDLPADTWLDVNVSPGLVIDHGRLAELLSDGGREVVLEITEQEAIVDYGAFRRAVERLGPGTRIAVDDAGAGFSSLRHIIELRPSMVKLDRGLIVGIERDRARRAMVAGMQHFALDAAVLLIAEGVETQAELATLRDLNVELSQGYLLGRPQPVESTMER